MRSQWVQAKAADIDNGYLGKEKKLRNVSPPEGAIDTLTEFSKFKEGKKVADTTSKTVGAGHIPEPIQSVSNFCNHLSKNSTF